MTAPVLEVYLTEFDSAQALRADARLALTATPKDLPPKWFYDAAGSELYEMITKLPEYYPFAAERSILRDRAGEIAEVSRAHSLVELGSGSSEKTRWLIDALCEIGTLRRYLPLDVSGAALRDALPGLVQRYPNLTVHGIVGDFTRHLARIPAGGRRMLAFLGGTVGNLRPAERADFFRSARAVLRPGEQLLLGTGLAIEPAVMVPAYDDAQGVTAEFNRNVLRVLNRELKADFDPSAFEHVALWDPDNEWIEMRLRATREMAVRVEELGLDVPFVAGEQMRTEVSAKFRHDGVRAELAAAGFELSRWWTDDEERFAVSLAVAV